MHLWRSKSRQIIMTTRKEEWVLEERRRLQSLMFYENKLYDEGLLFIAGTDECGRGALAGPVAAAAVILPRDCFIEGLNDSKKLSPSKRESLCEIILEKALAARVAMIDPCVIDKINILNASLAAMTEAINDLPIKPQAVLIDGLFLPDIQDEGIYLQAIKGGDGKSVSIATASVVAKVARDKLMRLYDADYPGYGFAQHKGYGTAAHYEALACLGPSPIHRRSFNLHCQ